MAGGGILEQVKGAAKGIRKSPSPIIALGRELLWVAAVVGGVALLLCLVCGTWPAVVAVESESMLPNMHVNDLVFVVEKDRFGELRTRENGTATGYRMFGDYGDVIIYRPNGAPNIHPIIHRAMAWKDADWFAANSRIPDPHGGYLTKGDNNRLYDQQSAFPGIGAIEPVKEEWIVGKALFALPLLGYPTLHYPEFAAFVIIVLILHELYASRSGKEEGDGKKRKDRKGRR